MGGDVVDAGGGDVGVVVGCAATEVVHAPVLGVTTEAHDDVTGAGDVVAPCVGCAAPGDTGFEDTQAPVPGSPPTGHAEGLGGGGGTAPWVGVVLDVTHVPVLGLGAAGHEDAPGDDDVVVCCGAPEVVHVDPGGSPTGGLVDTPVELVDTLVVGDVLVSPEEASVIVDVPPDPPEVELDPTGGVVDCTDVPLDVPAVPEAPAVGELAFSTSTGEPQAAAPSCRRRTNPMQAVPRRVTIMRPVRW